MNFILPLAPYAGGAAAALAATLWGSKKVATAFGSAHHYVEEKQTQASQLVDRVQDLVASAPQHLIESTKLASKKELAKLIHAFISEAEKQIPTPLAEQAPGIASLFSLNQDLKALLETPIDGANFVELKNAYDELFQKFSTTLETSEIQLHGFSLSTKERQEAPSIEELLSSLSTQSSPENVSLHELHQDFKKELRQLCVCLRRQAEISMVFGQSAPKDLLTTINSSSELAYKDAFHEAITAKVKAENYFPFSEIRVFYFKIVKFFTGVIVGHALLTFNSMVYKTKNFVLQKDQSWIMEFISKIFFEGLDLYTNAIINSADEIIHDRVHRDGNPSMLIDARLKTKKSLRAGFETQQEFYYATLDFFLNHAYSWSISRYVMKKIFTKTNLLESLTHEIQKATHDANGYQHTIDKNIISFVKPLLHELKKAPLAERNETQSTKKAPRSYSEINKEKLKNGIKSLFKAVELTQCSNLQELESAYKKGTTNPSFFSIDSILAQTAEAGAASALKSLQNIIDHKFLLKRVVEMIRAANHSFSSTESISEEELERTQNQRIEILNELTQAVVHKTVDQAPILNTESLNDKLNTNLLEIKQKAFEFLSRFEKIAEKKPASLPKEALEEALWELQLLRSRMEETALSQNLSSPQKDLLLEPINTIQRTFDCFIKSFQADTSDLIYAAIEKILEDYREELSGPAFALKGHVSILTKPIKRIAKVALHLLLQDKFNQAYVFAWDSKTTKYLALHQMFAALIKA